MRIALIGVLYITSWISVYSQNVGIGTLNPVAPLNIYNPASCKMLFHNTSTGTSSLDGLYVGNDNGLGGYIWNLESSFLSFGTNSSQRMIINQNGNVGIGINSPQHNLDIYSTTSASFALQNATTGTSATDGFLISNDLSKVSLTNLEASAMGLGTNGLERITITSSGLVGINNQSPSAVLDVYSGSGIALKVSGGLSISGNGQSPGMGKVLTSDSFGNAFWEGAVAFSANDLGVSNVSIPNGVDFQVELTSEEFDIGNNFNLTTSEFTAPVKGIYHFDYFVSWLSHTNGTGFLSATLTKNNAIHSTTRLPAVVSRETTTTLSANISLNAGDKVKVFVYQNSGVNQTISQDGRQVKFSGYLVCRQ